MLVHRLQAGLASSHFTRRVLHVMQPFLDFLCPSLPLRLRASWMFAAAMAFHAVLADSILGLVGFPGFEEKHINLATAVNASAYSDLSGRASCPKDSRALVLSYPKTGVAGNARKRDWQAA